MKLGIVGSRTFGDYGMLLKQLEQYTNLTEIVSGGAKGADQLAEQYARDNDIPVKIFYPDWDKHGRAAGPIRNQEICQYADQVIAF